MKRFLRTTVALSAAAVLSASVPAQTIGCEIGGAGGIVPASGTGGGGTYPTTLPPSPAVFPLTVTSIPVGATVVTEVQLRAFSHTYLSDLQMVLTDPSGVSHNLLYRAPGSCDFTGGDYALTTVCMGNAWAPTCTLPIPAGRYEQYPGAWASGTLGIVNTPIDSIPAATGAWTLTIYDWAGADVGTLGSWELCFGTPIPPGTIGVGPNLATPANGAALFGPNVNLVWGAVGCATSYEVEVDGVVFPSATTSYAYTSSPGGHSWRARAIGSFGAGPWSGAFTFSDQGPAPTPCNGQELTTLFAQNNGGNVGGQVFFDIDVLNPAGIQVAQIDTNTSLAVGSLFSMNVYMKAGTFLGSETLAGAWTLMASGAGIAAGSNQPSLVEFSDFFVPPGVHGVALVLFGAAHQYTGLTGTPPPTFFSNADLTITGGAALNVPWTGAPFNPRMWNGRIRYNCSAPPSPKQNAVGGAEQL